MRVRVCVCDWAWDNQSLSLQELNPFHLLDIIAILLAFPFTAIDGQISFTSLVKHIPVTLETV